ncbi:MAG: phenylacetate-CoA oxygenase subunit PaaI [Chitinophaga sp.]|jgi:ring-1,2-phenylacetyl-CoA epoxidase subunit PaaC|nr:phenylacetate-CoA oxygenase subunit PaaI [Chitinophaga sp.]
MKQSPNSQCLIPYILFLADSTLILSHRNSEWCGHGPILEQDIALTNIALDLLGQSRNFYQYAAELINEQQNLQDVKVPPSEGFREASEDSLAYLRNERDFKNLLLVELPNGDWGQTILKQFYFSTYQLYLFQQLQNHSNQQLAAIAAKAIKEVMYHIRWSSEWVIRLGDGTEESNERMTNAVEALKDYTNEMFIAADYEVEMAIDLKLIQQQWTEKVKTVFEEATLSLPEKVFNQTGGKRGIHTEHLGYILAEMQHLQRAYPNAEW